MGYAPRPELSIGSNYGVVRGAGGTNQRFDLAQIQAVLDQVNQARYGHEKSLKDFQTILDDPSHGYWRAATSGKTSQSARRGAILNTMAQNRRYLKETPLLALDNIPGHWKTTVGVNLMNQHGLADDMWKRQDEFVSSQKSNAKSRFLKTAALAAAAFGGAHLAAGALGGAGAAGAGGTATGASTAAKAAGIASGGSSTLGAGSTVAGGMFPGISGGTLAVGGGAAGAPITAGLGAGAAGAGAGTLALGAGSTVPAGLFPGVGGGTLATSGGTGIGSTVLSGINKLRQSPIYKGASAINTAGKISEGLGGPGLSSLIGGGQSGQYAAPAGRQATGPSAPPKDEPFKPTRPEAAELPGTLSEMAAFSPIQQRSALATQGINTGLGEQEQDYYQNLIQRQFVSGSGGGVSGKLLPVEEQFIGRQGLPTDIQSLIRSLQTLRA